MTTSASTPPDSPHERIVYYDIHNPDGTTHISEIRTGSVNYFTILNEDSNDTALRILTVYTIPKPCSITVRLGKGSRSGKPENTNLAKAKPSSPVTLNVTLYYAEVAAHEYGGTDGRILAQ